MTDYMMLAHVWHYLYLKVALWFYPELAPRVPHATGSIRASATAHSPPWGCLQFGA